MSAVTAARLWYAQRATALVLAACVVIHLAIIIYATRHGLTADAILGRTRGNALAFGFYALFVAAAAIHVPIGLAQIATEWLRWRSTGMWITVMVFAIATLLLGLRAVLAVVIG